MQNDIVKQQPNQPEKAAAVQTTDGVNQPVSSPVPAPNPARVNQAPEEDDDALFSAISLHPDPVKKPADMRQKSTKPTGVIASAVIVCALLVGATIYSGMQLSKEEIAAPTRKASNSANVVTPAGDTLSQDIDSSINEAANFSETADPASDLSDEALGL